MSNYSSLHFVFPSLSIITQVDRLRNEKCNLSTCCEKLQKDLAEINRESEKVKVSAENQGVQTDFPISSHEENAASSTEASNSARGRQTHTQQHETENTSEIKQENNLLLCR